MDGVDGAESKSEPVSSNEPVQLLVTMPDAKTRCLSVESKDLAGFMALDLLRCVGLGGCSQNVLVAHELRHLTPSDVLAKLQIESGAAIRLSYKYGSLRSLLS